MEVSAQNASPVPDTATQYDALKDNLEFVGAPFFVSFRNGYASRGHVFDLATMVQQDVVRINRNQDRLQTQIQTLAAQVDALKRLFQMPAIQPQPPVAYPIRRNAYGDCWAPQYNNYLPIPNS